MASSRRHCLACSSNRDPTWFRIPFDHGHLTSKITVLSRGLARLLHPSGLARTMRPARRTLSVGAGKMCVPSALLSRSRAPPSYFRPCARASGRPAVPGVLRGGTPAVLANTTGRAAAAGVTAAILIDEHQHTGYACRNLHRAFSTSSHPWLHAPAARKAVAPLAASSTARLLLT